MIWEVIQADGQTCRYASVWRVLLRTRAWEVEPESRCGAQSVLKVRLLCCRVLVGAPEEQTRQPGVERGGAVFRCDASRDNACQEVPFDVTGQHEVVPTFKLLTGFSVVRFQVLTTISMNMAVF
jgi:hypothetical protein